LPGSKASQKLQGFLLALSEVEGSGYKALNGALSARNALFVVPNIAGQLFLGFAECKRAVNNEVILLVGCFTVQVFG
jgi:hypothetical protein